MMQHAAAINVVEGPKPAARQIEQGAFLENYIPQLARRHAGFRHAPRRRRTIQPGDIAGPPGGRHLLRQHHSGIAAAPASHQGAQGLRSWAAGAENPMIHFPQMARAADDQALGLIPRLPLGIGVGIILRGKRGIGGVFHGPCLPAEGPFGTWGGLGGCRALAGPVSRAPCFT